MIPLSNDPNYSCLCTCSKVMARAIAHVTRCFTILDLPTVDSHKLLLRKL